MEIEAHFKIYVNYHTYGQLNKWCRMMISGGGVWKSVINGVE